jgi:DNA-binding NarL/FixJ family response regulator
MTLVRSLRHALEHTHLIVIGTALRQGAAAAGRNAALETPGADAIALAAAVRAPDLHLLPSLESVHQRKLWSTITPRQRDVLRWLSTGVDNKRIAAKLRVGERAVKAHVSSLLGMFGVANRTQLALLADRAGLRPPRARVHPDRPSL